MGSDSKIVRADLDYLIAVESQLGTSVRNGFLDVLTNHNGILDERNIFTQVQDADYTLLTFDPKDDDDQLAVYAALDMLSRRKQLNGYPFLLTAMIPGAEDNVRGVILPDPFNSQIVEKLDELARVYFGIRPLDALQDLVALLRDRNTLPEAVLRAFDTHGYALANQIVETTGNKPAIILASDIHAHPNFGLVQALTQKGKSLVVLRRFPRDGNTNLALVNMSDLTVDRAALLASASVPIASDTDQDETITTVKSPAKAYAPASQRTLPSPAARAPAKAYASASQRTLPSPAARTDDPVQAAVSSPTRAYVSPVLERMNFADYYKSGSLLSNLAMIVEARMKSVERWDFPDANTLAQLRGGNTALADARSLVEKPLEEKKSYTRLKGRYDRSKVAIELLESLAGEQRSQYERVLGEETILGHRDVITRLEEAQKRYAAAQNLIRERQRERTRLDLGLTVIDTQDAYLVSVVLPFTREGERSILDKAVSDHVVGVLGRTGSAFQNGEQSTVVYDAEDSSLKTYAIKIQKDGMSETKMRKVRGGVARALALVSPDTNLAIAGYKIGVQEIHITEPSEDGDLEGILSFTKEKGGTNGIPVKQVRMLTNPSQRYTELQRRALIDGVIVPGISVLQAGTNFIAEYLATMIHVAGLTTKNDGWMSRSDFVPKMEERYRGTETISGKIPDDDHPRYCGRMMTKLKNVGILEWNGTIAHGSRMRLAANYKR